MGDAISFSLMLPEFYFSGAATLFSGGLLSAIPALGTLSLAVGVVWGVIKRRSDLLLFLVLPALSQLLVAVAGALPGAVRDAGFVFWPFLLLQVVLAGFLISHLKGARRPALALAIFSLSYAFFAVFLASMSLTGIWM